MSFPETEYTRTEPRLTTPGRNVHVVGIGGSGLSAVARWLADGGARVSGSDLEPDLAMAALNESDVRVRRGHDASYLPDAAEIVIRSLAIPETNPEIVEARRRDLSVLTYAEALGRVALGRDVAAVAGTHGKTTTAAILAGILDGAGLDPSAVIGAHVPAFRGGALSGSSGPFVIESCEYAGVFETLNPRNAIVTSVGADHLELYGSIEGVRRAFRKFAARLPGEGVLVCPVSVARELDFAQHIACRVVTIGTESGKVRIAFDDNRVSLSGADGTPWGTIDLPIPGPHNAWNTACAVVMARAAWGIPIETASHALSGFSGIDRRFQVRLDTEDAVVVDDYAHHPDEIAVTLRTVRSRYPGRRVVAVFQPHLASRTDQHFEGFINSLATADLIGVCQDFRVRGREDAAGGGARRMADFLSSVHAPTFFGETNEATVTRVLERRMPGDVHCVMGAGDVKEVAVELARRLR